MDHQIPKYFLLSLLLLLTSCVNNFALTPFGANWAQYESPNFTLITDISQPNAVAILTDLEDFRQFARKTLNPVGGQRPRLTIIAASTQAGFSVFANPRTHGGLYFRTIDTDFMVINLAVATVQNDSFNGDLTAKNIIQHEYMHAVIADMPGKPLPLWYNEGLAEYFSTAERVGNQFNLGKPLRNRLRDLLSANRGTGGRRSLLQSRRRVISGRPALELASLKQIIEADAVSQVYRNTADRTNYHAQAWLLTHYFYGVPENRQKLETYLDQRRAWDNEVETFERIIENDLDTIDRAIWRRVRTRNFPTTTLQAKQTAAPSVTFVGPVNEAQMWCNVGRFKGFFAGAQEAKTIFRYALRLDANNVCAMTHLSKLESWDLNLEIAEQLTERAERLDTTDPFTPLSRAMIFYNKIRQHEEKEEDIPAELFDQGVFFARETMRLDPSIALPYIIHASIARINPDISMEDLQAGLASSLEAERLAPQNTELKIGTGILYQRLGKSEDALAKYRYAANWSRSQLQQRVARFYLEVGAQGRPQNEKIPGKDDL